MRGGNETLLNATVVYRNSSERDETLVFGINGISFQEYVGLQFAVAPKVYQNFDTLYALAWQKAPDGTVIEISLEPTLYMNYKFFDVQILSWAMAEEVTVTVYGVKDGIEYEGETITTTVENLALEKIAANFVPSDAKKMNTVRVLVDMLNYGAAVQTAFNHFPDALPNTQLNEYAQYGTTEDPEIVDNSSITGTGSVTVDVNTISLQSKVELQIAFKNKQDVSAYEMRITGPDGTTVIPAAEFDTTTVKNYTFIRFAVPAKNMRAMYTFALYDPATGEPVTSVYNCSVESYARGSIDKGNYVEALKAMMRYGDSVSLIPNS